MTIIIRQSERQNTEGSSDEEQKAAMTSLAPEHLNLGGEEEDLLMPSDSRRQQCLVATVWSQVLACKESPGRGVGRSLGHLSSWGAGALPSSWRKGKVVFHPASLEQSSLRSG